MRLGLNGLVYLLDYFVHFDLLGCHVRANAEVSTSGRNNCEDLPQGAGLVANVVKAKVMHDHGVPITVAQLIRDMPSHIVVHFGEILAGQKSQLHWILCTWIGLAN